MNKALFVLTLIAPTQLLGATVSQQVQPQENSSLVRSVIPHTPPLCALALMASTHLPVKLHHRVSTETLQNIQWGCFCVSICIIAGYFVYLHKKIQATNERLSQYANNNDMAAISKEREIAIDTAIIMEQMKQMIEILPLDQREKTKKHLEELLKDKNSELALYLQARNDLLKERDSVPRVQRNH